MMKERMKMRMIHGERRRLGGEVGWVSGNRGIIE